LYSLSSICSFDVGILHFLLQSLHRKYCLLFPRPYRIMFLLPHWQIAPKSSLNVWMAGLASNSRPYYHFLFHSYDGRVSW
jgi:hypothetical protein